MFTHSIRTLKLLGMASVAALGVCAAPMLQAAPIINGGFEDSPDFNGYATIGNTTLQAADFHPPVEGNLQALLSNGPGADTSGNDPVSAAQLETFLNLAAGTLTGPATFKAFNGSAIKQTFTANAGDVLTLSYDFLTNEQVNKGGISDSSFIVLQKNGGGSPTLNLLSNTNGTFVATDPLSGAGSFAPVETGYQTFSTTLLTSGTYTLGFGVTNAVDGTLSSALLVDAITVTAGQTGGGGGAVPLPAALLAMPLAGAVAGAAGKRLKKLC